MQPTLAASALTVAAASVVISRRVSGCADGGAEFPALETAVTDAAAGNAVKTKGVVVASAEALRLPWPHSNAISKTALARGRRHVGKFMTENGSGRLHGRPGTHTVNESLESLFHGRAPIPLG